MIDTQNLGNEPYQPTPYFNGDELYCDNSGLTKREYFSGLAMQSIMLNAATHLEDEETKAKEAVRMADALLKELSRER